ncbi:hypothetical protein AV521_25600 [Streptomyces sp. IMTB 2501]|uniref:hypothetical protein n=1 Tax=Streptomyces sp. IMTB 2501 TaxID=1776340 RepID=UPI00096F4FAB|nr:hypothetical protein [Streptomyces sp. IMTB 2501]OLZ67226.1 hypothetical protein AV521_25600 [Streptomyces sp. IMTB 2501]
MMAIQYFWRHPLAEQVRAEGGEEGREEGRIEGRREMILRILEWRGIPVADGTRGRVTACTDLAQLEVWAQRAVHATDAAELFAAE